MLFGGFAPLRLPPVVPDRRCRVRKHEPRIERVQENLDDHVWVVQIILAESEDRQSPIAQCKTNGERLVAGANHEIAHAGTIHRCQHGQPQCRGRDERRATHAVSHNFTSIRTRSKGARSAAMS